MDVQQSLQIVKDFFDVPRAIVAVVVFFVAFSVFRKGIAINSHVQKALKNRRKVRDAVKHEALNDADKNVASHMDDYRCYRSGEDITREYEQGITSVTEVLKAYIHRSHVVGKGVLNAVTEEMYDECIAASKNMKYKNSEGKPLFGLPISVKDCFAQKGTDSTCGSASRAFKPFAEDGLLVAALREAGALPFVRSNVPQLMMMPESENMLWGRTKNPWNLSRNPGGSSGGEGAMVAAGCSVLGLGSDIGGSIRIPAHFCGIVGFKPTPARVSKRGSVVPRLRGISGQIAIEAASGPLSRTVRDSISMMETLISPYVTHHDLSVCPLPFKRQIALNGPADGRRLRIAFILHDDWFTPVASCQRAVLESVEALRRCGHDVQPFPMRGFGEKVMMAYVRLMGADGNWFSFLRALEGEPLYETYHRLQLFTEIPNWLRTPVAAILCAMGESRKAAMLLTQKNGGLSVREHYDAVAEHVEVVKAFDEVMDSHGFDAIVLPALGIPSPQHGVIGDLLPALSYSFLANLLHWPAGVVPVTTVRPDEAKYPKELLPPKERDSVAALVQDVMVGAEGLPIGVQVMTRKWQDELCLYVMSEIEKEVNFRERPTFKSH